MTPAFWGMCFCVLRHDEPGPSREWHRRHYHAGVKVLVYMYRIACESQCFAWLFVRVVAPSRAASSNCTPCNTGIGKNASTYLSKGAMLRSDTDTVTQSRRRSQNFNGSSASIVYIAAPFSLVSGHGLHMAGSLPAMPCCHATARQVSAPGQLACRDPLPIDWQKGSLRSDQLVPHAAPRSDLTRGLAPTLPAC